MSSIKFDSTFEYKLIYVFSINDANHRNMLKVGEATIKGDKDYKKYFPNCSELNAAANNRIKQYTNTAGIAYKLEYTEIAVYEELQKDGSYKTKYFSDHKVHNVLKRSGIRNHYFENNIKANEWFVTNLATVKNAIKAVKNNLSALTGSEIVDEVSQIIFRPEQEKAITETIKQFSVTNRMLWNAKMRFGKTLSALEVIKRMKFKKSIIITHRPDVNDGWYKDFHKIFYEKDTNYIFGSKTNGYPIDELLKSNKPFVYFASIQDLRGSVEAGGKYEKNDNIFAIKWDFVITDEAHEGTQTELGKKVRDKLINDSNKELSLSGTPFNLFDLYSNDNTFTWDYIMEQEAKHNWYRDPIRLGDHNPYEELPKLNIFTYHLEKLLVNSEGKFIDLEDKAFNFKEFFRVWTGDKNKDHVTMPKGIKKGQFVHEEAINAFLDLLCVKDDNTNYPFSNDVYRDYFKHSLWMIPGVKEGKALEELLKKHQVFGNGNFKIVNVAGEGGDEFKEEKKALDKLNKAIGPNPDETRTITLSCGRLTTGVTVPEWTAVFMLYGSYTTDAKTYLQTIFRVQSPANINGKMKQNCYVFDFAPDRTLRVIHEAVKRSASKRQPAVDVDYLMSGFLNFCPVISFNQSEMIEYKAGELLQEIKRVYTERVVESGFEDIKLYNDDLLKLDGIELEKFANLQKIIGKTKQTKKVNEVELVNNGLTEEEREKIEELEKKKKDKKTLTDEEKAYLEQKKKLNDQRLTAISILRGISIRMPLLVYGLDKDFDSEISIEDLLDDNIVDPASWNEFMPNGVTKDVFRDFVKYYDKDIFISACRKIRAISKNCDNFTPTERIKELVKLFSKFKNPDKETVLTPWRVVNIHLSETIGGYNFYDDGFNFELDTPIFREQDNITHNVFNEHSKILEINSKTGLYPLYVAYSLYREKIKEINVSDLSLEKKQSIWDQVINEQIFIICKTPMAKSITKRTLLGYREGKINAHSFDDLVMQMKDKPEKLVTKICNYNFWGKKGKGTMKFNAVVGNPPYQEVIANREEQPPIYHYFYDCAFKLSKIVTLITPGRFLFDAGKTPSAWNKKMLNDENFKIVKYYSNSHDVFPTAEIKGGVAIGLRNADVVYGPINVFTTNDIIKNIMGKVCSKMESSISDIAFSNTSYKYSEKFFSENPTFSSRVSGGSARYLSSSSISTFSEVFFEEKPNDGEEYAIIIGRKNNQRVNLYFKEQYLNPPTNYSSYKVFLASSNGSGKIGEALSTPIIASPKFGATETFVSFGNFNTYEEANNLLKYFKTKFCRFMLGTKKVTQGNKNLKVWKNVPIQDFTNDSDINWNTEIKNIDIQLYKKYNLSNDELEYIEQVSIPME